MTKKIQQAWKLAQEAIKNTTTSSGLFAWSMATQAIRKPPVQVDRMLASIKEHANFNPKQQQLKSQFVQNTQHDCQTFFENDLRYALQEIDNLLHEKRYSQALRRCKQAIDYFKEGSFEATDVVRNLYHTYINLLRRGHDPIDEREALMLAKEGIALFPEDSRFKDYETYIEANITFKTNLYSPKSE